MGKGAGSDAEENGSPPTGASGRSVRVEVLWASPVIGLWLSKTDWGRFFVSPGFAGVAAVAAAWLAWRSVSKQLAQAKKLSAEERWWTTLMWVHERTYSRDPNVQTISGDVALPMFDALQEEVRGESGNDFQRGIIGAIASTFDTKREVESGASPVAEGVVEEATSGSSSEARIKDPADARYSADRFLRKVDSYINMVPIRPEVSDFNEELLESVLEKSESSSPAAKAALYERAAYNALTRRAGDNPPGAVFRPPVSLRPSPLDPDMLVLAPPGRIGVTVKWLSQPKRSVLIEAVSHLAQAVRRGDLVGGVVVTPVEIGSLRSVIDAAGDTAMNIELLMWRSSDPEPLVAAVRKVADNAAAAGESE